MVNAAQLISKLISAEMAYPDADGRRIIRDERMRLQSAVSARPIDNAAIAAQMREAIGTVATWGVEVTA